MNRYFTYTVLFVFCLLSKVAFAAMSCKITNVTIRFPNYEFFSDVDTRTVGFISYACSGKPDGTLISVCAGTGQSGNAATRYLLGSVNKDHLLYNLYIDPAYTTIWGGEPGVIGACTPPIAATASGQIPIYGKIFAGQDVSAESVYTDTRLFSSMTIRSNKTH
jgi:spore coat protein U-like protein